MKTSSPTSAPAPEQWDAEKFVNDMGYDRHYWLARDCYYSARKLAQAAYAAGQRSRKELPEEMPEWFPIVMYSSDGPLTELWRNIHANLAREET